MRLIATLTLLNLLACGALAQEATKKKESKVSDAAAYNFGYNVGMQFATQFGLQAGDINKDDFLAGFIAALSGKDPAVTPQEVETAAMKLQQKVEARTKAIAEKNLAEADAFLEKNKAADGVQTLPSGLQYRVLKSGDGASPTKDSTVTVHYEGKLLDGSVFDSSIAREEPAQFPVTGVIPGWTEALLRMKVGDRYQLFIPPGLAYGAGGRPRIPPNSLLTFEVELLSIK
ncbi:MAG TPA: hypothetical protein DDW52_23060 [Planctomycetaceae bacterium]|nr:hypothetical protein [Planctomycetaceae bacterium]